MKHFKNIFRTLLGVFLLTGGWFWSTGLSAQTILSADTLQTIGNEPAEPADTNPMDSVEVSLLTCSPHDEVYSLYGHTALRWHDLHANKGGDLVFNWGIFNFKKPHFVLRFVFGLTDYELGVGDLNAFCKYYEHWGSSVTEQVLNLTADEKLKLKEALQQNLLPENRIYRYNFFYDNCATRPRDIVEKCLNGKVQYNERQDFHPSYREMIGAQTKHSPWATFGNDILLGVKADFSTVRQQQEFLPQNLLYDFDHAVVVSPDGTRRPLISQRRMAVKPGVQMYTTAFPFPPLLCFGALLVVTLALGVWEWHRKKTFKYFDALLMLLTGLAGCVLTVMIFSQHPCTSLNLQLLLLNPLPLFFIHSVLTRKPTRWWKWSLALTALFLLGGIFQHYAEGMYLLALCLLLRVIINLFNFRR